MRGTLSTGEGEGQMQRGRAAGESVTELGERRGGQGAAQVEESTCRTITVPTVELDRVECA